MSDSLRPHEAHHARPPCPSPTPGVYINSCLWCLLHWQMGSLPLSHLGKWSHKTVLWISEQYFPLFSCVILGSIVLRARKLENSRLFKPLLMLQVCLCTSPTPGVYSNSCLLSPWCHPTISSSVVPFSCLQSPQHQGLFKWVSSLHQVAKVLEFQLQHQSFQWTPRTDLL